MKTCCLLSALFPFTPDLRSSQDWKRTRSAGLKRMIHLIEVPPQYVFTDTLLPHSTPKLMPSIRVYLGDI